MSKNSGSFAHFFVNRSRMNRFQISYYVEKIVYTLSIPYTKNEPCRSSMMKHTENRVNEEYWDEIIKEIIGEKKGPMFTNEIWEKMKDDHGYPERKETIEIKLFNLQREGYIKSVLKRKKQAWMFPSGTELLSLIETKTIDATIAKLYEQLHRVPSLEEVKSETRKDPKASSDDRLINERLRRVSRLLKTIDNAIKEFSEDEYKKNRD